MPFFPSSAQLHYFLLLFGPLQPLTQGYRHYHCHRHICRQRLRLYIIINITIKIHRLRLNASCCLLLVISLLALRFKSFNDQSILLFINNSQVHASLSRRRPSPCHTVHHWPGRCHCHCICPCICHRICIFNAIVIVISVVIIFRWSLH